MAELMLPYLTDEFLRVVEEERNLISGEYERDRESVIQRLGLATAEPQREIVYHRQGIGEMAVRTAVRATIWEAVFSLFRIFR